ncbi:C4-dicarboxylate ABC transporter substrate-binding protein [Lentibacillus amyloliquefaciens]|uniref:C4-dicarboxylate ABC transporter substrate-binding protein n=2 Tax=Lentibacillus amyloliquefaciens TaxID=1472767 RepID=A0A0U4FIZ3_9BACI|nr:C4-dicarboxylate ABC transporter substrate-binding protein [Lentibacillus amyloliquefaciens]
MTIKFSHNQPLTSPEHTGAKKFKKVVEDKSNGNITVEIYGESQLGSLREQVESTQIGEIDITMQPPAAVTPFVDDIKIVDLPYLWPTDAEKMYSVMDGKAGKALLDTLGNGGFKGLGFWPGGYKLFTTKDTEIHSPEDLEGLKMRTMASPVLINQYEHWGGNAIPVPYGEVYNSLQQGIVDGQENPLQTIYSQKYYEVQNHVIESKHGPMSYLLMTNQSWFKGLDDNVQSLIVDAEKKGRTAAREAIKEKEDEFRENIKDSGVNYYELTDEEIEKFKEKSKPYWEKALDTSKQMELLDKVKKAVQNVE